MYENIKKVGLPKWSDDDQTLAKALQQELKVPEIGPGDEARPLDGREEIPDERTRGGGSDDIGDVSWNVPTVTLRYPSNIPGLPGHNWANAIAMATPIAHKGVTAGAKVQAMTMLDLADAARARRSRRGTTSATCRPRTTKYKPLMRPRGQAGDLAEQEDMDEVPAGDEEVLLRSDEVQDLPRTARASSTRRSATRPRPQPRK